MRTPDLDKERSEKRLTASEFLAVYNEGLPPTFPRASLLLLETYQKQYANQFKEGGWWSLDLHRKKVMDWLPAHLKLLEA
ncbi:MAG: hypothetical protein B7X04_02850 [Parcubacteria group bacterium 21-54-25]|nr:MAG: hypothetical protein B7X04_02850 [Parcubacteria group bacterium 21-54-25]HQU07900.1 hypothetical protein [Candidatus Paceibacterota bacterium]